MQEEPVLSGSPRTPHISECVLQLEHGHRAMEEHMQLLSDADGLAIGQRYAPGGECLSSDPAFPFEITLQPNDVIVNTSFPFLVRRPVTVRVTGIRPTFCSIAVDGQTYTLANGVLAREFPKMFFPRGAAVDAVQGPAQQGALGIVDAAEGK
ncbi:hypothetical protein A2454_06240 [Candidatus Peribacteria bacterium RIFOXYC2_FULL_55_14]|nr:MAG: hypothetical protein UY85_C0001G0021 [Candidatus Peribacteria bacterium GW2011_GWB1_54_5]OGJ71896.1 MAG: hypothetical protein A2198_03330 [Candidatus Peribacteria bacterium RIFOXYA1_FULL_56_14]OGJ72759.1 MAG: hypothetical protein A2217_04735 [Candidatus Peribacteria bacterium RIFOXYA2_FULL_55_28]OGJ75337.1 MAG: hypothetical protein A2384_00325 [Candidatus Peribacteria bacterium RIFOXYB1_FULL_54_35]OGJ76487.1 MAG: hypothetical protein A2327_01550 [Candidatus Peribacteria bacterium RIFOXY